MFLVATNVVASQPPEGRLIGKLIRGSNNLRFDLFQDPVDHFGFG